MVNHFINDESKEFFREFRIEIGIFGKTAQARDLFHFAVRVGGGKAVLCLVPPDGLCNLEPFGQHEDQCGVDIVNALAVTGKGIVAHVRPPLPALSVARLAAVRKACLYGASGPDARKMSASVQSLGARATPSLDPLIALVSADLDRVNQEILARMQSEIPLIPELAGHIIAGGGKRMRPMLTLAGAALLGYDGARHVKLAAAVEFIHTATLLHDDVVDGSDLRRGRRTANIIWGNPASVLVGDFLFSRSFELMVEAESLRALDILSNASAVIAEGEVHQLTAVRHIDLAEEQYLEIIGAKTAALFAAACRVAAVVASTSEASELALDAYGRNLGIAFQLVDDAIDYVSDAATMGKDAGDDFREGKMTLPVILAYARGGEAERSFWRDAVAGRRNSDEDLAEAVRLVRDTRALDDTLARARHYGQRAIDALAGFASGPAKDAMVEAVEFATARAY